MATDKLKAEQDRLCEWLSSDSEHVLKECGDLLSMNQYRQIETQSHASDKMRLLLETIIRKGEDTCLSFVDILRKNRARYPQLQQFFNLTQGAPAPTVFADSSSVYTAREINDIRGKTLSIKTELVSGPGSCRSGNFAGPVPPADHIATGGSYICFDKICNVNVDGDIDLSVTSAPAPAGRADAEQTWPSSEEPAVKTIREHKPKLIECLMADCVFILQHVHSGGIVTDREYKGLMDITQSERSVTRLIDLVIEKGQETCSCFLQVLKKPDIQETYPKLKDIARNWH